MTVPRELVTIVNTAGFASREYSGAVTRWPSRVSIWEHLQSRAAKESFVSYIVRELDPTNTREYSSFTGRCTGFAVQMYVRYNDSGTRISRRTEAEFARMGVQRRMQDRRIPRKLRMPIYVVLVPNHAFNAVLIEGAQQRQGHASQTSSSFFPKSTLSAKRAIRMCAVNSG